MSSAAVSTELYYNNDPIPIDWAALNGPVPHLDYENMPGCRDQLCATIYNDYAPELQIPNQITDLEPAWVSCVPAIYGAFDPPYALQGANSAAGPAPIDPFTSTALQSTPAPTPAVPVAPLLSPGPSQTVPAASGSGSPTLPSPSNPSASGEQLGRGGEDPAGSDSDPSSSQGSGNDPESGLDPVGIVASVMGGGTPASSAPDSSNSGPASGSDLTSDPGSNDPSNGGTPGQGNLGSDQDVGGAIASLIGESGSGSHPSSNSGPVLDGSSLASSGTPGSSNEGSSTGQFDLRKGASGSSDGDPSSQGSPPKQVDPSSKATGTIGGGNGGPINQGVNQGGLSSQGNPAGQNDQQNGSPAGDSDPATGGILAGSFSSGATPVDPASQDNQLAGSGPQGSLDGSKEPETSELDALGAPIASAESQAMYVDPSNPSVTVVDGETLSAGASKITIGNTPISVRPGAVIVGPSTIALTAISTATAAAGNQADLGTSGVVFTKGSSTYTVVASDGNLVVGSSTLTPGAVFDGQTLNLVSGDLVIGSLTYALLDVNAPAYATPQNSPSKAVLAQNGQAYTAVQSNGHVFVGSSLLADGALLNGQIVSIASNELVVGSSTYTFSSAPANPTASNEISEAVITEDGKVYTAIQSNGAIVIGSSTLQAGDVFDGQTISEALGRLIIGSSTYTLSGTLANPSASKDGSEAVFTQDDRTYTALESNGEIIIGSSTLTPGALFNGQKISETGGDLIVGPSAIPLSSMPATSTENVPSGSVGGTSVQPPPPNSAATRPQHCSFILFTIVFVIAASTIP